MSGRAIAWWRTRSTRERRLVGALGLVLALVTTTLAARGVVHDAGVLRARIARGEQRLTAARLLAGRLAAAHALRPGDAHAPLVSLVEAAVVDAVGTERLTRLEPGEAPDAATEARLAGVDLADVVRVLGALEDPMQGLHVRDLELRRRPDEPTRYDVALVVVRGGAS